MEVTNMAKWSERIEKIVKENQEIIDLFHEYDKRITHYRDAGEYKRYTQLFDNMCNILIRLESEDAFNAVMLKVFWKQPYFSKLLELLREKRTKELKEEEKQEIEDECAIVDTFYDPACQLNKIRLKSYEKNSVINEVDESDIDVNIREDRTIDIKSEV